MKIIRTLTVLSLVLLLTCGMLFANAEEESSSAGTEKIEAINMMFFSYGTAPDEDLVLGKVNEVLEKEIGARLEVTAVNLSALKEQSNLMLASGEKVDILINGVWPYFAYGAQIAKNQLLAIDDLLEEYGQGILASMDKKFLDAGKVNGQQYMIPTVRDFAGSHSFVMRKDIVDELNIDVSAIKDMDDVERVLMQVRDAYPDIIPLIPFTVGQEVLSQDMWDQIGNPLGVLMDFGSTLNVVNLFETEEYYDLVSRARRMYENGLILKDAATNQDDRSVYMKAGRAFSYISRSKPGYAEQESLSCGQPLVTAEILPAASYTGSVANLGFTIPRNSTNPAKAIQVLNYLYSDPDIFNLFVNGIEGVHYVKTGDGFITYPEGMTAETTPYGEFKKINWELGNQFLGLIWEGNSATAWSDMEEFNNSARKSKAMGFVFDITPVKNEVAACTNVLDRYKLALLGGMLDPDEYIPEFNEKLYAAGLDKIITEKQRQLDAWAVTNGIN